MSTYIGRYVIDSSKTVIENTIKYCSSSMDWRLLHLQIVIFCYTFNLSLDNTENFESALP